VTARRRSRLRWVVVIRYVGAPADVIGPYSSEELAQSTADKLDAAFEEGATYNVAHVVMLRPARAWRSFL